MAGFIVLWPYLLTTKLKSVIRHNLGHSKTHVYICDFGTLKLTQDLILVPKKIKLLITLGEIILHELDSKRDYSIYSPG